MSDRGKLDSALVAEWLSVISGREGSVLSSEERSFGSRANDIVTENTWWYLNRQYMVLSGKVRHSCDLKLSDPPPTSLFYCARGKV